MDKDYSKLDPESRQQMAIIDLQAAADKNAKDIEELNKLLKQIIQNNTYYFQQISVLFSRVENLEKLEKRVKEVEDVITLWGETLIEIQKAKEKLPRWVEVIKNLFKRK